MIGRLVVIVGFAALVGCGDGCGCNGPKPSLTLSTTPSQLVISGSGFTNVGQCAQLSLIGLPTPVIVPLGNPACSGGAFSNYVWPYKTVGCQAAKTPRQIAVLAVGDLNAIPPVAAVGMIDWHDSCGLAGYCGEVGQDACPSTGCSTGVDEGGKCVPCGGEGQPVCGGNQCMSGLNPNVTNGVKRCTALCGHTQGWPCTTGVPNCSGSPPVLTVPQIACITKETGTNGGTVSVYTCFDSRLPAQGTSDPSTCICMPDNVAGCQISTSQGTANAPTTGLCIQAQTKPCP